MTSPGQGHWRRPPGVSRQRLPAPGGSSSWQTTGEDLWLPLRPSRHASVEIHAVPVAEKDKARAGARALSIELEVSAAREPLLLSSRRNARHHPAAASAASLGCFGSSASPWPRVSAHRLRPAPWRVGVKPEAGEAAVSAGSEVARADCGADGAMSWWPAGSVARADCVRFLRGALDLPWQVRTRCSRRSASLAALAAGSSASSCYRRRGLGRGLFPMRRCHSTIHRLAA